MKSLPYQDTKYFVVKKPCGTFLLFSKCISRIHDHFQKWQILFPIVCTDCTVITVRSTNKKLIAVYYYYGQTLENVFVCYYEKWVGRHASYLPRRSVKKFQVGCYSIIILMFSKLENLVWIK